MYQPPSTNETDCAIPVCEDWEIINLQGTKVIAATSITQSTQESPQQMVMKVDLLLRKGVTTVEIFAADLLQLPNVPLLCYIQTLKDLYEVGKKKTIAGELQSSLVKATVKFKADIQKLQKHIKGMYALAVRAEKQQLDSKNLLSFCVEHNILVDDPMITYLKEAGKTWHEAVKKALVEHFNEKIVHHYIHFTSWKDYYGNPAGLDVEKNQFIQYLKYLQNVYKRFEDPEFKEYKRKVSRHAELEGAQRYKDMASQLFNLLTRLHNGKRETGTVFSLFQQSLHQNNQLEKIKKPLAQLAGVLKNKKAFNQGDLQLPDLGIYQGLTHYQLSDDAQQFSLYYLLSEFAVLDMWRQISKRLILSHHRSYHYIVYHGDKTEAVSAHYNAAQIDYPLRRHSSHVSGGSPPSIVLHWLAVGFSPKPKTDLMAKQWFGRFGIDNGLNAKLLAAAKDKNTTRGGDVMAGAGDEISKSGGQQRQEEGGRRPVSHQGPPAWADLPPEVLEMIGRAFVAGCGAVGVVSGAALSTGTVTGTGAAGIFGNGNGNGKLAVPQTTTTPPASPRFPAVEKARAVAPSPPRFNRGAGGSNAS